MWRTLRLCQRLALLTLVGMAGVLASLPARATTTLVINQLLPPADPINQQVLRPWAADVERVTDGRVRISLPNAPVAAPEQLWNAVIGGIVDGAYVYDGLYARQLPMEQITALPFVGGNAAATSVALWDTYRKFFANAHEYRNVKLLALFAMPSGQIFSLGKPIVQPGDLVGRRMWVLPGAPQQILSHSGAGIISSPAVQVSELVAGKTVDAIAGISSYNVDAFKVMGYMKSETVIPGGLGYDDSLASGCVSSAGTLGALVPPSIPLLIYGIITQQDIAKLFVAGVLPGILLGSLFMAAIWWTVRRNPALGPAGPALTWADRRRRIAKVWPIVLLFALVMGGLYSGIFTANEAGGIGAAGALLFTALRRKLSWSVLIESLVEAGRTTALIFAVAFGGMVFANFVTMSGLTGGLVSLISGLHLPVTGIILVIMAVYVVLGSMMESISMMLLTVPVFAAVLAPLGVSMLWFGIFVAMMIEIGMIHPPVGMNVFMVNTMMPELSVRTIFAGTIPFLVANFAALALIIAFPAIATWLPAFAR